MDAKCSTGVVASAINREKSGSTGSWRIRACAGAAVAAIIATLFFLVAKWPFTERKIIAVVGKHFDRKVTIGKFQATYFPPGFVAEDIRIEDGNASIPPLAVARKLVLAASYYGLIDHHVNRVDIQGLDISIPPRGSLRAKPLPVYKRPVVFDLITLTGGSLRVLSKNIAIAAFETQIRSLELKNASQDQRIEFHARLVTTMPPGEIRSTGTVGPWNLPAMRDTPLSGTYTLDHADLAAWKDISGYLSAAGKFDGTLAKLRAEGAAEVAEFHIKRSKHKATANIAYRAIVDEENGNVELEHVEFRLGRTNLISQGDVSSLDGRADKTVHLNLSIEAGTLDDLLQTVTEQEKASMTGAIRLEARVQMPPGEGFIRRVHLRGNFGIAGAKVTNPKRQSPIDHLGLSAQGASRAEQNADHATVLSALRGHVALDKGIATLTNVSFRFEGSAARLSGTYDLLDKNVAMRGVLKTEGKIADTTKGWKAALLNIVTPFVRKGKVTTVYFTITGTSAQPKFSFSLHHKG